MTDEYDDEDVYEEGERPPELPEPHSMTECLRMLADASIVFVVQRSNRGSIVGLYRIRRTIDALLDAYLRFSGPPICMSIPYGSTDPCGRVKSRFGSGMYLCSECDMRRCENTDCERRVLSLNNLYCNPCRGVTVSQPWVPPAGAGDYDDTDDL